MFLLCLNYLLSYQKHTPLIIQNLSASTTLENHGSGWLGTTLISRGNGAGRHPMKWSHSTTGSLVSRITMLMDKTACHIAILNLLQNHGGMIVVIPECQPYARCEILDSGVELSNWSHLMHSIHQLIWKRLLVCFDNGRFSPYPPGLHPHCPWSRLDEYRDIDHNPDSKVHGANMASTWVLSAPGGPM